MATKNTVLINIDANTKPFHEAVNKLYTGNSIFTKKGLKALINAEIKVSDKDLKEQAENARKTFERAIKATKGIEFGGKNKGVIGSFDLAGLKRAYDYFRGIKNLTEAQAKSFAKIQTAMTAFKSMSDLESSINRLNNAEFSGKVAAAREKARKEERAAEQAELAFNKRVFYDNARRRKEQERISAQKQRTAEREANIIRKNNAQYERQHGLMRGIVGMMSRYVSIYSAGRLVQRIAETTGYFEQQKVALEGILGTASDAQKVLNDIKDFALKSPFQTKELVGFTKQLSAFGLSAEELFPTVKKLSDLSAGLGVDMGRLILAYGQVKSASVLRGQELRQFTEAGIPLVQKLADKFTELRGEVVTTADVFELISKRQVSFQMVDEVLSGMTSEGGAFYKMQENITDTLYGQIQKLKDMWTIALDDIGKNTNSVLMGIVKILQYVVSNAKGVIMGLFTTSIITQSISKIKDLRTEWDHLDVSIRKAYKTQKNFLKERAIINAKSLGLGLAASAIGVAVGAIINHISKLGEAKRKLQETADSFNKETNKLVRGFSDVAARLQSAAPNTKAYNDAIETLKSNYGEFVNVSDELVATLRREGGTAEEATKRYIELNDAVAAAIKLKQDYNKVMSQKQQASDIVVENSKGSKFWGNGYEGMTSGAIDLFGNILASGQSKGEKGKLLNQLFGTRYEENVAENIRKDLNSVIESSYAEFTSKGYTDTNKLQEIFARNFGNQFIGNLFGSTNNANIDTWVNKFGNALFNNFSNSNGYQEYLDYSKKASGDGSDLTSMLIRIGNIFGRFNPSNNTGTDTIGKYNWTQNEYIQLLKEVVGTELSQLGDTNGLMSIINGNVGGNFKAGSVKEVLDAIEKFANSISDPSKKAVIEQVLETFRKGTDALTDQEAAIADRMNNVHTWDGKKVNGVELDKWFQNWNPAVLGEQTVQQTRDKLSAEYESLKKELESYASKNSPLFKDDIEITRTKMAMIEKLAGKDLYNVDLSSKKGGGTSQQLPVELSDFISKLKNAYETYKKATGAEGAYLGLGYMQNDTKMQERFANFFNGGNGAGGFDIFKGIKVGAKEASDVLQDAFIKDGLEGGVLNFEKGAREVAKALDDYYKADKEHRKQYETASKSLIQWADSIAKDNVAAWIDKVNKELSDLSKTFERTSQDISTYRDLMSKGTAGDLGKFIGGVSSEQAKIPLSTIAFGDVNTMIAAYNKMLTDIGGTAASSGQISGLNGNENISQLRAFIDKLTEQMKLNSDNFSVDENGEFGKKLKNMIEKLIRLTEEELKSISGETFTGNALNDALANAITKMGIARDDYLSEDAVNKKYGGDKGEAVSKYNEEMERSAKNIVEAFLDDNKFEALFSEQGTFKKGVDWNELRARLKEIVDKLPDDENGLKAEIMDNFDKTTKNATMIQNAGKGDLGQIGTIFSLIKNSRRRNEEEWSRLDDERISLEERAKEPGGLSLDEQSRLGTVNKRLDELGNHGEKKTTEDIEAAKKAFEELGASVESTAGKLRDAFTGMIDSAKSFSNAINKAYDVMNDGENPEWMQDMDGFLSDLSENFEAMVAPIFATVAAVTVLTVAFTALFAICSPLAIILAALVASALVVAVVMAAFQQHDRQLDRENKKLTESIENVDRAINALDNAMTNLNAQAERMAGLDRMVKQMDAIQLNSEKSRKETEKMMMAQKQLDNENAKKNTDEDKVKEYQDNVNKFGQNAQEAMDKFVNGVKSAIDEITSSADSWAESMSNAIRSAFQNGENAARAFRNVVKEMMGDVVENMLMTEILGPQMQEALDKWTGREELTKMLDNKQISSEEMYKKLYANLKDTDRAKLFYQEAEQAGEAMIDAVDGLPKYIQDLFKFNAEEKSLSGGIESVTEDTARRLEALQNSQLGETVLIRQLIESIENAQSNVLRAQLTGLMGEVAQIRTIIGALDNAMTEMRNNINPLYVKMS